MLLLFVTHLRSFGIHSVLTMWLVNNLKKFCQESTCQRWVLQMFEILLFLTCTGDSHLPGECWKEVFTEVMISVPGKWLPRKYKNLANSVTHYLCPEIKDHLSGSEKSLFSLLARGFLEGKQLCFPVFAQFPGVMVSQVRKRNNKTRICYVEQDKCSVFSS